MQKLLHSQILYQFSQKWLNGHPLFLILLPFSWLFRLLVMLRRCAYRRGYCRQTRLSVPVIIVGNLTIGGNGKTPLVIHLAQQLQQQGFKPGIITRGYGGCVVGPQLVPVSANPSIYGDEPALMSRKTTCPIVIARQRVLAAEYLIEHEQCNLIISDDGLQHYALARDIEIVVVDGERRFANGQCFPAGPLREPLSRLFEVDFIVSNSKARAGEYLMTLEKQNLRNLLQTTRRINLAELNSVNIHAVTGIGNPQRFYTSLRELNINFIEHSFPDHYNFSSCDFASIAKEDLIIMTEKDAVKCESFATENMWVLPVHAQVADSFITTLVDSL